MSARAGRDGSYGWQEIPNGSYGWKLWQLGLAVELAGSDGRKVLHEVLEIGHLLADLLSGGVPIGGGRLLPHLCRAYGGQHPPASHGGGAHHLLEGRHWHWT